MFNKEENKEITSAQVPADIINELNDTELEDVSGGLFGITIMDTCQKKYDYNHCFNNFGFCAHLDVHGDYIDVVNGRSVHHILCSCNNGFFDGVSDTHMI